MAEQLSPHERQLLDALQAEDSPSPSEQQRVQQRLFAQLGLSVTAAASGALVGSATQSAAAQSTSLAPQAANLSLTAAAGQLGSGAAAGSAGTGASSLGWASLALTKLGTTKAIVGASLVLATAGGAVAVMSYEGEQPAANAGESAHAHEAEASSPDDAPGVVIEVPATTEPLHAPVPVEVRQSAPLAPPAKRPPALVSRPSTLQEEAALLGQAQQAIAAGQGTRAMALLLEHQTRFPSGTLSVERQAALAIARCQSGQLIQGQKEAERFRRAHPKSPMRQRLETACQLEPR